MKLNKWTNHEVARLRQIFATATLEELDVAFPRHPRKSILSTGYHLGLRRSQGTRGYTKWAVITRQHVPVFGFGRTA